MEISENLHFARYLPWSTQKRGSCERKLKLVFLRQVPDIVELGMDIRPATKGTWIKGSVFYRREKRQWIAQDLESSPGEGDLKRIGLGKR